MPLPMNDPSLGDGPPARRPGGGQREFRPPPASAQPPDAAGSARRRAARRGGRGFPRVAELPEPFPAPAQRSGKALGARSLAGAAPRAGTPDARAHPHVRGRRPSRSTPRARADRPRARGRGGRGRGARPLLLLAEPSERALRWSLAHLSDAVYRVDVAAAATPGGRPGGAGEADAPAAAAAVRWEGEPCEIVELAVAERWQGRGVGRAFLDWIAGEAGRRGKREVEVGTANASIGNIAFYQRCGFRMHRVRRDYFGYYRTPRVEHGIAVRDLLVFRRELR
jgi:GNAT superfamily N-acetyltransferase